MPSPKKKSNANAPDEGAFSFLPGLTPEKLRDEIRAREFLAARNVLKTRRPPDEWTGALLVSTHREIFGHHFPDDAGHFRMGEAHYGDKAGVAPEQIEAHMQQLIAALKDHLGGVTSETDEAEKMDKAFLFASLDHAQMIRIHPFVDGNGRWARIVTNAFLYDCGYTIGTILRKKDKPTYIAALNRCIDNNEPGDLAELLLTGYSEMMRKRL